MTDVIDYNTDLEHLLKIHAEECESFSILHRYSYEKYNERSNYINIPVIILSSAIGFATGIDIGYDKMNIILGVSSIFVGIIKSIDTYFQLGKRSESHRLCSLQFQQINKKIMIELSLKRDQRISAKDMLQIIKTDIKNLQDIAPLIDDEIVTTFKKNYGEEDPTTKKIRFTSHTPNLCNGLTQVIVNGDRPSNADGRGRRRRRRGSQDRRSRGGSSRGSRGSRGSGSYDSDDDSSSGDNDDGRGGKGGNSGNGDKGGNGGNGGNLDIDIKKEHGNVSSASSSSGFMSSVSNMIQRGVNYIKGSTPSPRELVLSSNKSDTSSGRNRHHHHHHHSSQHHSSGHKNDTSGVEKQNKIIEITSINESDRELLNLINHPSISDNSAANSGTSTIKNTPQLVAMVPPAINTLTNNFTVVNISDIQEPVTLQLQQQLQHLQQLQQLQQVYHGQNSHRSQQSQHSHQSQHSQHSHQSYRPAIPEAVASAMRTPLRTTPTINNQISVQNINNDDTGSRFVLSADIVYNNSNNSNSSNNIPQNDNAIVNITTEPPNLILTNENINENNDNIVVDIMPLNEQIDPLAIVEAAAAANLPPLHFDIDDPEGMM